MGSSPCEQPVCQVLAFAIQMKQVDFSWESVCFYIRGGKVY